MQPSIDRFLVGLHPSEDAENTLSAALRWARRLHARVDIACVVESPSPAWIGFEAEDWKKLLAGSLTGARAELEPVIRAAEASADYSAGEDPLHVLSGKPAKALLAAADRLESDVVVLGPHARGSIFDFGGTTRSVLAASSRPVWIQRGDPRPADRILVSVDFSEFSRRAMEWAAALAARVGASVQVYHCFVPPSLAYTGGVGPTPTPDYVVDQERHAARRTLETFVAEQTWGDVPVDTTFDEGEVVPMLVQRAKDADLVVMGTHGHSALNRFLLGSRSYGAVKRLEVPTVVVPGDDDSWSD